MGVLRRAVLVATLAALSCTRATIAGGPAADYDGGSSGAGDDGGGGQGVNGADGGGGSCAPVAAATSAAIDIGDPLNLSFTSAAGTTIGGDQLLFSGTSTLTGQADLTGNTFLLVSTGPACGLGGVTSIPSSGYTASVTLQQGYGYIGQLHDATYVRFYVSSLGTSGGTSTAQIDYEYPTTLCPTGQMVTYGGNPCVLMIGGVTESETGVASSGGGCAFAVVGCNGTATVQAWGAGGSGADICIALSGGAGGGGGGGGGFGAQPVTMVPGDFYLAVVGAGGSPTGDGYSSCPTPAFAGGPGGASSFGSEDGGVVVVATGGQGGTGGGATGGAGGGPGTSTATINATGTAGSDGVSNTGSTLCGGSGSCGPGGTGGDGAGPDAGAGGAGGCTPGTAGGPGGGGAGGSQLGPPTNGAVGQVTIRW